jgi:hypothetical protein
MPVFGYGGFLPFALEVFAMYSFLEFIRKKMHGRRFLKATLTVLIVVFIALSFHLMDNYSLIQ